MKKLLLIALLIMGCDNSTFYAKAPTDCFGIANGTASIDDCGVCAGGTTGVIANADKDCAGECGGDEVSCPGCTDNTACNYNPAATEDDDSCINPDENYGCDIFQEYTDFESINGLDEFNKPTEVIGDGIYGECSGVSETEETGGNGPIPPLEFSISAYPNPFQSIISMSVAIPQNGLLDLFIVNPNYERVATLVNGNVDASSYTITWNGTDEPDGYYRTIGVFGEVKCFRNLHKSNSPPE